MSESADYTHRKYGMQQPSSAKELLSFRFGNEPLTQEDYQKLNLNKTVK